MPVKTEATIEDLYHVPDDTPYCVKCHFFFHSAALSGLPQA